MTKTAGKKKRLKDKIFPYKTIIIHKLIERYADNVSVEHKAKYFLVTIKDGHMARVMFRADSLTQLWKLIKEEGRLYL